MAKLIRGVNDLATVNPKLASEWNYEKNGDLKPTDITANSGKKVWWLYPYDNPITGKHFDFEWPAKIANRNQGDSCPFLNGTAVWQGFNDLATVNPELASQWHPTKNGDLKPTEVTANSNKIVWWLYPYDNPKTGKHFDFEWSAKIIERTNGTGCPFLNGTAVWISFNDLVTVNPELASQWHPTKNGDLKPTEVTAGSNKIVWWLYSYDNPITGKHFDFEWLATISSRNQGIGCPFLSGKAVWQGFNDLVTTNSQLAKEWHPTKNGNLKPTEVIAGSNKIVWWLYSYDDPITGKHFDFEWSATISSRNQGIGCPFLSGKAVWQGFNDLATVNPELASQWHPTKNDDLKPTEVTVGSNKKVWWLYPYDDPITGKHFDFEWSAKITERTNGTGCPFLNGTAVWQGLNDLATTNPQLAKEWNPTKNGKLKPTEVTKSSVKKVWWLLPYDDPITGKHFDFEWPATIAERSRGRGCPFLSGKAVWQGFNDLATTNPQLAKEWYPTKNEKLKPTEVTANSAKKVWWLLPYDDPITGKHFDFEWSATIAERSRGYGCPFLSGKAIWQGFNDLVTTNPQLAKEWHPTKNGNLKPTEVTSGSEKKVWWLYSYDNPITGKHFNFEWSAKIRNRNRGAGCPFLSSSKTELLIYSLMKKENIKFEAEKIFQYCKDKKVLPFDVYLPNENIIIECDGMQHFQAVEYFDGKEGFKTTKFHDRIKNNFCKDNDIPILRIPYIYDPVVDKQKIELFALDFIKTRTVPQEILDYYSQYKFSNYVECVEELNERFSKRVA